MNPIAMQALQEKMKAMQQKLVLSKKNIIISIVGGSEHRIKDVDITTVQDNMYTCIVERSLNNGEPRVYRYPIDNIIKIEEEVIAEPKLEV
jgi:hypothetical protein